MLWESLFEIHLILCWTWPPRLPIAEADWQSRWSEQLLSQHNTLIRWKADIEGIRCTVDDLIDCSPCLAFHLADRRLTCYLLQTAMCLGERRLPWWMPFALLDAIQRCLLMLTAICLADCRLPCWGMLAPFALLNTVWLTMHC